MKMLTRTLAGAAATALLATSVPQTSIAQEITVVSWGGSYSASQRKAYYEPFMKETGLAILEDEWDGSIAILRAVVETGNYKAHVYDGSVAVAVAGCDEGLLEPINWEAMGMTPDDFLPGDTTECGIATIAYGTLFAYRTDVVPEDPPKTWADFWNAKKYPASGPAERTRCRAPWSSRSSPTACRRATSTRCCAPRAASIAHSRSWRRSRITSITGRPPPKLRASSPTRGW